jgi:LEA14-like dessication related protein
MKTNIEVLFVIFLIIINLLIGGIFLYLIFTIDSPDIYAEISIKSLTSDEIKLNTKLDVDNPNPVDIIIKNIRIVIENDKGVEFTSFNLNGGEVSGSSKTSFSSTKSVELNGNLPRILRNKIKADVGVRLFGIIEKNIPTELNVVVSLDELLDDLKIPTIKIHAAIENLTDEGLLFSSDIEINNPNDIELIIEDTSVELKTEKGVEVGKINLKGGTLSPRSTLILDASGNLLFDALDAKSISIDLLGKATASIAGITQSLNISASAVLDIPDLIELLNLENDSFDFSLYGEFKLRARGAITTVTFVVHNPSEIPLITKDMVCYIYGVTNDKKKVVVEQLMEPTEIAAGDDVSIEATLTIPYIKLLTSGTGRIFPQWIAIVLDGYLAFENTNQAIPVSINGILDPHVFR